MARCKVLYTGAGRFTKAVIARKFQIPYVLTIKQSLSVNIAVKLGLVFLHFRIQSVSNLLLYLIVPDDINLLAAIAITVRIRARAF